jgi:hypothetical protein
MPSRDNDPRWSTTLEVEKPIVEKRGSNTSVPSPTIKGKLEIMALFSVTKRSLPSLYHHFI